MENGITVPIQTVDMDMASVISQNSREKLYAFLKRMDWNVEEDWDKEALALILKDAVIENPEYILTIYGKEIIDLLILIWESDQVELDLREWTILSQLPLLGFLDFQYFNQNDGSVIRVVKEAKEYFYFYLKSKTARGMLERYDRWENMIRGLMTYYGIIGFDRFYYLFCRLTKSPIDDREFHRFLSVRLSLLQFGGFAMEKFSNIEYYHSYEVSKPEDVLDKRSESSDLEYYFPDYEEVLMIAENNGIGNWDGIGTIVEIFLQLLDIEYYKTVVAIKTCILMAQNEDTAEAIEEFLIGSYPECRPFREKIHSAVYSLYNSIPIYSLKGWNRKELRKKQRPITSFTVIKGGKSANRKKGGN